MHIVLTVNAGWNIWNFRKPVVEALLADGHQVTILAPNDDTAAQLETLGAHFVHLEMDVDGLSPASSIELIDTFRNHFHALRPDIVLSYTVKNNIFGAMAARTLGIPFLPNVTGLGTLFLGSKPLFVIGKLLYRLGMGALPIIFVQNDDDHDFLVSKKLLKAGQLRILPGSGIDLESFPVSTLPASNETITFLMISRLIRDKGTMEYLEAARIARTANPKCTFQLLGPMGSANRTAIPESALKPYFEDGSVDYLGATNDVRPFVEAAHCVVLPSYREGAPRSLIEAAAMGRPLVTTDAPGCRAVVENGKSGLLCQVRDAQSLAQACLDFAELDPCTQQAMGDAGRDLMAREYDVGIVIDRYRTAIAELTVSA
ncbi:glycosyltransferase family 4 protein [Pontixanthobacter aestiaquae]|uniref:Glycosyltransferase n=1 Tax=Pontixanthobacter aestiaquae TaxID=1509367 RepID=A0A844Z401_9SPHN|nr:glycosyltransferase family 4 protein [Pontixanthobacter aestiaquae]MDN3646947.1 glycosyltransferase family 4 protein [Pontixanthobacter aestiaquae]MXO82072.1 glycosyltransferase [Pontixanthobacter aestiaquae]